MISKVDTKPVTGLGWDADICAAAPEVISSARDIPKDADNAPVPNAASLTAMPLPPSRTCTLPAREVEASSEIEAALWHCSKKFCMNTGGFRRACRTAGSLGHRGRPRTGALFISIHQNRHAAGDVAAVLVVGLARPDRIEPEATAAEHRLL